MEIKERTRRQQRACNHGDKPPIRPRTAVNFLSQPEPPELQVRQHNTHATAGGAGFQPSRVQQHWEHWEEWEHWEVWEQWEEWEHWDFGLSFPLVPWMKTVGVTTGGSSCCCLANGVPDVLHVVIAV